MFSQKKALFPCLFIGIGSIALLFSLSRIDYRYDYAQFDKKINTSLGGKENYISGEIKLDGASVSLVMAFDKEQQMNQGSLEVTWLINDKKYTRMLDTEDADSTDKVFTFPFVTEGQESVTYIIASTSPIKGATLITTVMKKTPILVFNNPFSVAHAKEGGIEIISRKEWGADENLRFWNSDALAQEKQAWEARGKTPFIIYESESDVYERELEFKRGNRIKEIRGDAATIVSLQRYEGGKKLLWPIKKTKTIDRIVIHHTAENLEQDADDASLLRAIYAYHARTRGWGDIGYNYIIGQRGQIYEGRAGGDYVEGAHAYANNLGSIGISVIGNFEKMNLNRDQKKGLEEAIVYFGKKYGINLLEITRGVRLCKTGGDCLFDEQIVNRLHGHTDVGYTSCPGKNLYSLLDTFRMNLNPRIGSVVPVTNPHPGSIDPIPLEDAVEYRLKDSPISKQPLSKPKSVSRVGKKIKIKLSYPHSDEIVLEGPLYKKPDIRVGKKRIVTKLGDSMKIHTDKNNMLTTTLNGKKYQASSMSFSTDIVRIASWSRVPSWDTSRQYNDNTFRGKITVYNNDGKLLVVNEVLIEDYLRGLGEVTDRDPAEKIKTIQVAARTYAVHYINPKNRKFNTKLYDLDDSPDSSQEYKGYGFESRYPLAAKMVDETRGEVITYEGKLIKAWYFSASDGRTLSYEEYCKKSGSMKCMNIPYLQSVDDPAGVGKIRYGHGVGISGIGASYFALEGWNYKKIIQYYMKGVEILKK